MLPRSALPKQGSAKITLFPIGRRVIIPPWLIFILVFLSGRLILIIVRRSLLTVRI